MVDISLMVVCEGNKQETIASGWKTQRYFHNCQREQKQAAKMQNHAVG